MEEKKIIEGKMWNPIAIPIIGVVVAVWSVIYSMTKNTVLPFAWFLIVGLPILLVTLFFYWYTGRCKIIVTNLRVYGKAAFGKQVDLPYDSISAVGTFGLFHGVSVATSSGTIKFMFVTNAEEVFSAISKLLRERQNKVATSTPVTVKQEIPQSAADELKKYKDLLDSGVITQKEFDAKKKQLLGL